LLGFTSVKRERESETMNALKRLGASAALGLAGLAVVAVGSTAAVENTELCKVKETKCSAENSYTPTLAATVHSKTSIPTETTFSMTGATTFQCGNSVFEGWNYTHSGGVLKGSSSFFAFAGCTEGWELDPDKLEGYATEIRATAFGNGAMSILGSPTLVAESATLKCLYSPTAKTLEFAITGGELGKMTANVKLEKKTGSSLGCASKATFTGTYEAFPFTGLGAPMFVTE
jgi:hypothetical protein